jgi:hypothetical protein
MDCFYDLNMLIVSVIKCNVQVCQSTGQWGVKNEKAIERGVKFLERDPEACFNTELLDKQQNETL